MVGMHAKRTAANAIRGLLLVVAASATAGCLRLTTTVDLRADGSGTIVQESAMSAQAIAMIKGFAAQADTKGKGPAELFGEEQARKAAESMGVTFVSGEVIKSADLEGYRARYSFDDVTKIRVTMDQSGSGQGSGKGAPFSFAFDRRAASSLLTIQMPEGGGSVPGMPPGGLPGIPGGAGASDAEKAQAEQAMTMMKMMMKGLFVDVALNVSGRVLKSNAPQVEGSRVTLLQIDFDKLIADETALQKLQGAKDLKALASVPGLKIAAEPKVTVEFSR
jgi:hypothetical protein